MTESILNNPLKADFKGISTGNEGVPTDKQTNRQTDKQNSFVQKRIEKKEFLLSKDDYFNDAVKILNSLDAIKKEIRIKFKRLTNQEIYVFSTMYQLDEENGFSDYKTLSEKLQLTESSVREYIGRIIKKGIPIEKTKINNKLIHLNISSNLKQMVSLSTILQLREI